MGERAGWHPSARFNAEPAETEPTEPQNPGPTSEDSASEEMSYSPQPPGSASDVGTLLENSPDEEAVWNDASDEEMSYSPRLSGPASDVGTLRDDQDFPEWEVINFEELQ